VTRGHWEALGAYWCEWEGKRKRCEATGTGRELGGTGGTGRQWECTGVGKREREGTGKHWEHWEALGALVESGRE